MIYQLYDLMHAALTPARIAAEAARVTFQNPMNPLSYTNAGRTLAANAELFERMTRKFGQPVFGLTHTTIDGRKIEVEEEQVARKPFCRLTRFKRRVKRNDPKVLIVAPMSGHFATLLRGTVEALLPHHEVYITEWIDARQIPLIEGRFNLDDYVDYLIDFIRLIGKDVHLVAVCQPAVPVMVAASLLASWKDPDQPRSMVLMGGPIDTRVSPTQVNELAKQKPLGWFEHSVCTEVPFYYPGAHRKVYPGFLQLSGFMSMNLDRHIESHMQFYQHLIRGDGADAETHRKFYNEYLAVMDLPAEFYLQTVEIVFQKHQLPKGTMKWRDPRTGQLHAVVPQDITKTALMTIEGELDDISANGQTTAAHDLASSLATKKQYHHFQESVGHYGIFNGRRWRENIMPRMRHFFRLFGEYDTIPEKDLKIIPDRKPDPWDKKKHGIEAVRAWRKTRKHPAKDAFTGKKA